MDLPDDHVSDLDQARRAVTALTPFTTTPDDAFFCWWDGQPDFDVPSTAPLLTVGCRRYAVLRGTVSDIDVWPEDLPPAFVWPADRSWCFTSDVDPHWACVGGSEAAMATLRADPVLDLVDVEHGGPAPYYW